MLFSACICAGTLPRWEPVWQRPVPDPLSSFGMWRNRINWFGNNESDANLNIFNYDQVSSHWFPTRKGSHACAGWKTGLWRRHGRGRAGPSRMKMWSSPGHELISKYSTYKFGNNKTPPRHIRRERERKVIIVYEHASHSSKIKALK